MVSAISIYGKKYEFLLDKPNQGIYIPNLTWANQLSLSEECIYFIAASDYYKEEDYIRNWEVLKKNSLNNASKILQKIIN